MSLALLGAHYGWPMAELENLTAKDAAFWLAGIAELKKRIDNA